MELYYFEHYNISRPKTVPDVQLYVVILPTLHTSVLKNIHFLLPKIFHGFLESCLRMEYRTV